MSECVPSILILGHFFVRRLRDDLDAHFDLCAAPNFHIPQSGHVFLLGTGSRTVDQVFKYDLSWGTNNLSIHAPAVVGSKLDDLAHVLRDQYKVRVVVVCQVINRNWLHTQAPHLVFYAKASLLQQYLSVVLAKEPGIFVWAHCKFSLPGRFLLYSDGVHCNSQGQYCLYWSYRGAILKALTILVFCAENLLLRLSVRDMIIAELFDNYHV